MKQKIYLVYNKSSGGTSLVRACNQIQALRHVAKAQLIVKLPTQDELLEAAAECPIETAGLDIETTKEGES